MACNSCPAQWRVIMRVYPDAMENHQTQFRGPSKRQLDATYLSPASNPTAYMQIKQRDIFHKRNGN